MCRIAWFSSITSKEVMKTAICTRELFALTPEKFDIELFVGDADYKEITKPVFEHYRVGHIPVWHYLHAYIRDLIKPFDLWIFQLEDNARCGFVLDSLRVYNGICWFHDWCTNRIECARVEHHTTGHDLNRDMTRVFGESSARLGDVLARGWPIDVYDVVYPRGGDVVSAADVRVLSGEGAYTAFLQNFPNVPHCSAEFPIAVIPADEVTAGRRRARKQLGYHDNDFVVGFSGSHVLYDNMWNCIEAFRVFAERVKTELVGGRALRNVRFVWLVTSPSMQERALEIMRTVDCLEQFKCVVMQDVSGFERYLCGLDLHCVLHANERHGEPVSTYMAMSRGVPCIVADGFRNRAFPDGVVARVPLGLNDVKFLSDLLWELYCSPDVLMSMSEHGKGFVETVCDPKLVWMDLEKIIADLRAESDTKQLARCSMYQKEESIHLQKVLESICGFDYSDDFGNYSCSNEFFGKNDVYQKIMTLAVSDFSWMQ